MPTPRSRIKRFQVCDKGGAAVEFAMISPILMYVFMAIIEVAIMFFASVNIDGAAIDAARRIRTGQTQSSADPLSDFSTTLCNNTSSLIRCGSLFHDVRTVTSFGAVNLNTEIDPTTGEPVTYGFTAGGASDIVVVRVMYYWTFYTPMIGTVLATAGANRRLLESTVVFQNEPYE